MIKIKVIEQPDIAVDAIGPRKVNVDTGHTISLFTGLSLGDIPIASDSTLGILKLGPEFSLDTNHRLTQNYLSTDKLIQGEMEIIVDGGKAGR